MKPNAWIVIVLLSIIALGIGCGERTPNRDHIPALREALFRLQEGIGVRSRAAIDSLLSIQMLSIDQSSDSLLSFIYGRDDNFAFDRLGDYEIFYTSDKARIDCYIMDTSGEANRPLTLTYVLEHDLWLLKRFEPGRDSTDTP